MSRFSAGEKFSANTRPSNRTPTPNVFLPPFNVVTLYNAWSYPSPSSADEFIYCTIPQLFVTSLLLLCNHHPFLQGEGLTQGAATKPALLVKLLTMSAHSHSGMHVRPTHTAVRCTRTHTLSPQCSSSAQAHSYTHSCSSTQTDKGTYSHRHTVTARHSSTAQQYTQRETTVTYTHTDTQLDALVK